MLERILELVRDESKWLPAAMLAALVSAWVWIRRARKQGLERAVILGAMNRFYGCMLGVMGLGHLLAITLAGQQGTLRGSPWVLYPIGFAIAVPAWLLFHGVARLAAGEARWIRRNVALNALLGLTLVALGLHNLPLAAPAGLNLAYQFHTRRSVGWVIVSIALAADLALFAGALVFLASGQTFEQFSGT
jgi:hypothetical protein